MIIQKKEFTNSDLMFSLAIPSVLLTLESIKFHGSSCLLHFIGFFVCVCCSFGWRNLHFLITFVFPNVCGEICITVKVVAILCIQLGCFLFVSLLSWRCQVAIMVLMLC